MAKKSKLLAALDAHKGRDFKLEKQKKQQKSAEKKKKSKSQPQPQPQPESSDEEEETDGVAINGKSNGPVAESDGWESDESEDATQMIDTSRIDDSESESDEDIIDEASAPIPTSNGAQSTSDPTPNLFDEEDDGEDPEEDDDIPLSDIDSLASSEKADLLPHQRLTINNTTALTRALASISSSTPLPFSTHQTLLSPLPISIPDPNDDLTRELAFYSQCLASATEARTLLQKEKIPFSRPTDYFAEMVKSDEHMGKIKQKMHDEASNRKASAEARKQRDLKKFGKQVQVARGQERAIEKREMLGRVESLKRKRKNNDSGNTNEEEMFDIALEDASKEDKSKGRGAPNKRQKKNEKFGFGGKKRFAKSGDAASTGDLRGFSAKKMKGKTGKPQRPGKSRRAKA